MMAHFTRVGLLKDMIDLFEESDSVICIGLFDVGETLFLLNVCAETLETLGLILPSGLWSLMEQVASNVPRSWYGQF